MEGQSRRKKNRRVEEQRTLQGNCNEKKARIPEAEDEKERMEPDSTV